MNGWYLTGIVVWKGYKRSERAPWPCLIETDGGTRDRPTLEVPLDIFGDIEVGQRVELTGFLDSREWKGNHYLQLTVKTRKVEWPPASDPPRPQQSKPWPAVNRTPAPPRQESRQPPPSPMPEASGNDLDEDIPF